MNARPRRAPWDAADRDGKKLYNHVLAFLAMKDRHAGKGARPLTDRLIVDPSQAKMKTMSFARFIEIPLKRSLGYRAETDDWSTASHATDVVGVRAPC